MTKANYLVQLYLFIFFFIFCKGNAQTVFNAEYTIGKTSSSLSYFPKMKMNQTMTFSIGKKHDQNLDWVQALHNPETGLMFEYSDYGNKESIGESYAISPYIELPLFKNFSINSAAGISYFTKKYNDGENWRNKAISTDFTFSYRLFLYYKIWAKSKLDTRLSLGYSHHSNGHVKWPNNGLNTLLVGLNFKFTNTPKEFIVNKDRTLKSVPFYSFNVGIGQQSLSRLYNENKEVYATAFSIGKIYKKTFKIGLGFYYRFYENYYDYIKEEGLFVNEDYPYLKKNIVYNSSTYGLFVNGEILMNHIAIDAQLGINIDKPFYKIDYRINKEKYNFATNELEVRDIDSFFWAKRFISCKLGLKYYLFNTKNLPKNNFFAGAYIVSNLGQADYSELGIGFTRILQ